MSKHLVATVCFPSFASTKFLFTALSARANRQIPDLRGEAKFTFTQTVAHEHSVLWFVHTRTLTRRDVIERNCSLPASQNLFPRRFVHGLQGCLSKLGYECHVAERNEYFVHVATTSRNFISARNTTPKYSYFLFFFLRSRFILQFYPLFWLTITLFFIRLLYLLKIKKYQINRRRVLARW